MNALLSIAVWLALIMLSCCGHIAGHENEEPPTASYDDNLAVTTGYEYLYINSAIYADFPEAVPYIPNKASGIGQRNLLLLLGLAVLQRWY